MADVDLTPTAEMARNAARGLELRREHGRGGTEVGVARARDISNGKTLSPETVRRMHAFFSRHAKNKAGGEDDAGYIAWMLWGGDEGRDWASRKVDALDRKERNAMSETRKAIMERLGMAAGGEKQVFASPDDIMEMAQMLSAVESAVMHKRIEEAKSLLRKIQPIVERNRGSRELDAQGMVRAYNDYRRKLGMSRPGAKAKFSAAQGWISGTQLGREFGREIADELGRGVTSLNDNDIDNGLEMLARAYEKEGHNMVTINKAIRGWMSYKQAAKLGQVRASRPGAKAKMGRSDEQMISRLESELQELGYRPSNEPGLAERMNAIRREIKLLKQSVRASRLGAKAKMGNHIRTVAEDKEASRRGLRVMIDQLESEWQSLNNQPSKAGRIPRMETIKKQIAGLEDRLKSLSSRPGAKAKMAADAGRVARAIAEHNRERRAYEEAKERLEDLVRLGHSEQRIGQAERAVQLAEERMNEALNALKNLNSRPGAKVRAALADACWEGYEAVGTKPQDGKTVPNCVPKMKAGRAEDLYRKLSGGTITNANVREWDRLVTEALRMPDFTPPGGDMSLHEIAEELGGEIMALKSRAAKAQAAKPAEDDLEREDVKAGLKLMAASDPAVSDKIRTLIKEGKPQDQAVAIALDMKRRGEL